MATVVRAAVISLEMGSRPLNERARKRYARPIVFTSLILFFLDWAPGEAQNPGQEVPL